MLVSREALLAVVAFELGFSSYAFGDAELAIWPFQEEDRNSGRR